MPSPGTPVPIKIQLTASKVGINQVDDVVVKVKNNTTGEIKSGTTQEDGKVLFDGANFTTPITTSDTITVWVDSFASYDDNIQIDNNDIRLGD